MIDDPFAFLRALFDRAVAVADPMICLAAHLPARPKGRVVVVGAGKASARMAQAVIAAWKPDEGPIEGLVITRYGHTSADTIGGIEIVQAAHPIPDAAGRDATARMMARLDRLGADDFVLALISGGASALLTLPCGGVSLADKQAVNAALLASGAPIAAMNTLRKHLSRVKGGQLAAAAFPARMLALMISDVPGDDLGMIGSGPAVGDASAPQDALAVLRDWNIAAPKSVIAALQGKTGVIAPQDPRLSRSESRLIAAPVQSLAAAADLAAVQGCDVQILGDAIQGEAQDIAAAHAALALQIRASHPPRPVLLLSGGELTVTHPGVGNGGPNAEYALALALALKGAAGIYALACDTDGIDGAALVAGAVIGPETLRHPAALDGRAALLRHDSHAFFASTQSQVITGPTQTNVNDFRAILICPQTGP